MKPIIRYISLRGGRCGLSTSSVREIEREEGTANIAGIRNATEKDVAWIRGMGGHVPDGRIVKARE